MQIELHSPNKQFNWRRKPKYIKWVDNAPVKVYSDQEIYNGHGIALMIEPKSIQPEPHEWLLRNFNRYDHIFTHDSELLKFPNAHKIYFGGVWDWSNDEKTKNISMITSNKEFCHLHRERLRIANELRGKVDVYGLTDWVDTRTAHAAYRFAVVMENYIDDWWFTEKICNCFANKVIPIYLGARCICHLFDSGGIIRAFSVDDIPIIVDEVLKNPVELYESRLDAIEENYDRVSQFECFEDWFYQEYKEILENV